MRLGNGRWENTTFNSRLQPTQIGLGNGVDSRNLLKLEYEYGATASANNGNVTEQTITVPGVAHPFVQAYTYDELNRLKITAETREPDPSPATRPTSTRRQENHPVSPKRLPPLLRKEGSRTDFWVTD